MHLSGQVVSTNLQFSDSIGYILGPKIVRGKSH